MLVNKLKLVMKQDHRGVGGLYFLITMMICSFILIATVRLSWDSQAISIANNLSQITAINVAVNGYLDNTKIPKGNYTGKLPLDNYDYRPLTDFNNMLQDLGIITSSNKAKSCTVEWDGNNAKVQFGEFTTSLGSKIKPHEQNSIIEKN